MGHLVEKLIDFTFVKLGSFKENIFSIKQDSEIEVDDQENLFTISHSSTNSGDDSVGKWRYQILKIKYNF